MQSPKPASTNYINLFIAFGFGIAWAFFWAVDTLLAYVLFGGACFFVTLFIYNLATQQPERAYNKEEKRKSFSTRAPTFSQSKASTQSPDDVEKIRKGSRVILICAALAVGFFLLYSKLEDFGEGDQSIDKYQLYNQAEQWYAGAQYDSAYYYYKASLNIDANMQESLVGLGNTLYMQAKVDSALWYYEKALSLNPAYTQARYNVGWWYYDQKRYRESVKELKMLVSEDPSQLGAMQLVGDNFYSLSEYDSAIRWYEGAYTSGARSRWLCHVMAYIYDTKNELDKAIPLYQEAIQYDTTMVDIYVRLGELLTNEEGNVYRFKAAQLKLEQGK